MATGGIPYYISMLQKGKSLAQNIDRLFFEPNATDFYSKFYLSFIDGKKTTNPTFWQDNLLTPSLTAWRGFTFESVCIYHLPQMLAK